MAAEIKNITLDEAIRESDFLKKNTFIWITKENIFNASFSEGYAFNSIGVTWVKHTYSCTCYMAVDCVPHTADTLTFMIGANQDNGYYHSFEDLRKAHPRLFEVVGEFKALTNLLI